MNFFLNRIHILNALFGFVGLLLFAPAIQREFHFFDEKTLTGAFSEKEKPTFDSLKYEKWFNGSFQTEFNDRLEADIGFRNSLVRLTNQFQYSFFSKANAEGVIVGKQGELFEEDYIRAAMGEFFVGDAVWIEKARKLKAVQDTLNSIGKKLLIIFEPGKGSVYTDHYPAKYDWNQHSTSNYTSFKSALALSGVQNLDLNACFNLWRDTVPYRIFPRTGTHWSYYGAALAADTTLSILRGFFGERIPQMFIDSLAEEKNVRHPDDDIWLAMNLLKDTPNDNLAYPVLRFEASKKQKITALLVGDSFYFNWQNDKILLNTFAESDFWYYNKNVYNQAGGATGTVASLNFGEQIMKQDLIIMMITDRFNHCFMWNFDEQLYDYFYPGPKNAREVYANDIRTSNEYFLRMYKEAKATGMPFQDRLKTEVEFKMYLDYLKDPKQFSNKEDVILMLMMSIKGTPDWYEKIKTKAKERNMAVDEMLRLDAEWVYNERQKGI